MGVKWEDATLGAENRVRINELIPIVDYRNNVKFREYRFVSDLVPYATQWLPIYKDGKPMISQKGKPVRIPYNITNFDPDTGKYDSTKPCPFVEVAEKISKYLKDEEEVKQLRPSTGYYAQAISRKLQANPDKKGKPSKEERASGFISGLDSEAFTPVEVHQLNYSIQQGLKTADELNTHRIKGQSEKVSKSCADPKYGADILIKFDSSAQGTGKYKVQKGNASRLDPEAGEDKLLLWDIASAIKQTTLSRKEAKIEAERIWKEFEKSIKKGKNKNDSPDDDSNLPDDIESSPSPKKSSKDKKKSSSKKKDSPEESPDSDDSPDLSSSDFDSPSPKKSSKDKKKSSSKKKKEESPEESPDLNSPEDSPSPKKSSKDKKKSSSKKKDSPEDEDDDDESPEFDLDDEDEDEED